MIEIYCDESHDDTTYTLAGWIATPSGWARFSPAWRAMLDDFNIPSFHASELVNRDIISDSRFKGWDFADETRLFTRAVDIICDKRYCAVMWPIGCSVSLAGNRDWIATPDTAWKLLFVRLFMAVLEKYPAQNGISFMFDDKPEVRSYVDRFYRPAREAINEVWPGKIYGFLARMYAR